MDIADWRLEYIGSKRWPLTVDEAALVAASIPPDSVFRRVWHATSRFHPNSEGAAKVAGELKQAIMNGELYVTGRDVLGFTVGAALGKIKSPHELGKLDGTEIFNDSRKVWAWLVDKGFLPQEYIESDRAQGIESTTVQTTPLTQNNESKLVSELTQQLQQAHEEIAKLKATSTPPVFLHMTQLLQLAADVQKKFWGDNWLSDDSDTDPKQVDIIKWVEKDPRCTSKKRAELVAILANPRNNHPTR